MMKCIIIYLLCALLLPATVFAGTVEITEWDVPWEDTRPRDPFVDRQGRVWFVGQTGDYAAFLDPSTGMFKRFDLDAGSGPHNLVVDDRGMVWYAGNRSAHIGRLDPESGTIKKFPMPKKDAYDPHTLVIDQSGTIWFTVQRGNYVGRFAPGSGSVDLIAVPTGSARPYGIVIGVDGVPWFAEFGSFKLGRIDVKTMSLEEIALPRKRSRPRRLAATSDGSIWYVDYRDGYLGRYRAADRTFQEWRIPGGEGAMPYGMAVDGKDRLWFVETGPSPNRLVGFDPETESFLNITDIPSGGGSVRHMYYDAKKNEIWFGTDTNTVGRARLP